MQQNQIPVWVIVRMEGAWVSRLNMYERVLQALAENNFDVVTRYNCLTIGYTNGGYVIPVQIQANTPISEQRRRAQSEAETEVYQLYQHAQQEERRNSQFTTVASRPSDAEAATYQPYRPPSNRK